MEVPRTYALALKPFGFDVGCAEQGGAPAIGNSERIERMGACREFQIAAVSRVDGVATGSHVGNQDHAIGVRVGEGLEEDRVDCTEDCGGRADAERQGEHGDSGKAGVVAEAAHGQHGRRT